MNGRIAGAVAGSLRGLSSSLNWRLLAGAVLFGAVLSLSRVMQQPAGARLAVLPSNLLSEALALALMSLAAGAADLAIRRGWRMWIAFSLAICSAGAAVVAAQVCLLSWLGIAPTQPHWQMQYALRMFSGDCTYWGMAMLVYLNHRSAARMLAGVRTNELERVRIEQRLLDSRLSAAKAQLDPARVMHGLAEVRDLYAGGQAAAETQLEALIEDLRSSVYSDNAGRRTPERAA